MHWKQKCKLNAQTAEYLRPQKEYGQMFQFTGQSALTSDSATSLNNHLNNAKS